MKNTWSSIVVVMGLALLAACGGGVVGDGSDEGAEALSSLVLPGRVQAEDFTNFHDTTPGNTGGAYRQTDVDLQATTDTGGGYNVGWTAAGEWLEYDVQASTTGVYTFSARVASKQAGTKKMHLVVDGTALGAASFTSAAGWQSWLNLSVGSVQLTAGAHTVQVVFDTELINLNYLDVTVVPSSHVVLGHFDSDPARLELAGTTNATAASSNGGVDTLMARTLGVSGNVSQIMKSYESSWRTSYASSGASISARFGHAFAMTMPAPGGGGNAGYQAVLNGSQDAAIDSFFKSIPTTETAYVILQNEADNVNSLGTDPALYSRALGYVINRAAPIYKSRGLKGGVGPVFMTFTFKNTSNPDAAFETWNFIQYVAKANLPYVVYSLDCYSKYLDDQATTYESIPAIVDIAFSRARKLGVTRFGIGEFANSLEERNANGKIVGTPATQEKWINAEIPKMEAISGLEFAVYFHKPTGQESKNAELVDKDGAHPFTAYAKKVLATKQ